MFTRREENAFRRVCYDKCGRGKRMMWKRKAGAVLLLAALSLYAAGCSKKEHGLDPAHPVTVTVWHYYNSAQKKAFDALVDEFNATVGAEKGIIVEGSSQGSVDGLESNVSASMNQEVGSQALPNIFQSYADLAFAAEQKGILADLGPYFSEEEQSRYVDSYIEEGHIGEKGALKIFPIAKSTEVMMLNKTDWEPFSEATGMELSALSTKEGVVRVAEAYYRWTDSKTPDIPDDGKAFYGRDALANLFIIGARQLGCEIFQVDGDQVTLDLDRDVMRRIWDVYYIPTIRGYFGAYGRFRSDDAKVGKLLAVVGSTSSAAYFPTEVTSENGEVHPIEAIVLPTPCFEGGDPVAVQQGAGMAVVKSTPAQEYASVLFLKWFTEAERNLRFSYDSGYLPVLKEANNFDLVVQVSDGHLSPVKRDTLRVAFDTVGGNVLYTNKAFAHGDGARKILEYSMADKAQADSAEISGKMADGMSREEAVALYDTEENFEAWYEAFRADLEEAVRG